MHNGFCECYIIVIILMLYNVVVGQGGAHLNCLGTFRWSHLYQCIIFNKLIHLLLQDHNHKSNQ